MAEIVEASFTVMEMCRMDPLIPIEVHTRMLLSAKGFRFTDDDKFGAICNRNPVALGTLERWEDPMTDKIHFRQIMDD